MNYLKSKSFFVSLDTRKSFVMKKASKYKLDLINDISGLSYDNGCVLNEWFTYLIAISQDFFKVFPHEK